MKYNEITLPYKFNCNYRAASRFGIQTGIIIEDMCCDVIRLRPTNTLGTFPPCTMQIPKANLKEFIDELQKLL